MASGPDKGFAWVVALSCFVINFIMAGLARTVGVLYVAIIDLYGVSREAATTPFSIRVCVRNMTGPLVGLLGLKYGIRGVTAIGGLVAALGSIFCYFAPNVFWITIFWGVIHGLGFGLSTVLHMIVVNQYFDKYRASALGLGYSGDCFGSFVFPVFIEHLFAIYDVRGAFLIIGGVVLNVIPMALLLRKPPWIKNENNPSKLKTKLNNSQKHAAIEKQTNILSFEGNKAQKMQVHSCGVLRTVKENDGTETREMDNFDVSKSISDCKINSTQPYALKGLYNEAFNSSETSINTLNKDSDIKTTTKFTMGISDNSAMECSENRSSNPDANNETDIFFCNSNEKIDENFLKYTPTEIRTSRSASDLCNKNEVHCTVNRSVRLEKNPYINLKGRTESLPPLFEKEKGLKDCDKSTETTETAEKTSGLENEYPCTDGTETLKKRTASFVEQVAHEFVNRMRTASFASQVAQDAFVTKINQESDSESDQASECELKSIVEHKDHDVDNCTHQDLVLSVDKSMIDDYFKSVSEKPEIKAEDNKQKAPSILKVFIRTNAKPMFILISISMAVYAFLFTAIVTIIIDYASDHGIPGDRGKYLIIGFSVADLIGRLTFGQVIDRKLMKIKNYAGNTILLMGILSASIPLNVSFNYMMVCMCMYGLVQGGTAIMFPILVNTYMDKSSESVAMGCLNFYGGLLILLMAPMIGFFRDNTGSYNSVFYITGGVVAVVGVIWQFEPMIIKFQNRKLKEKYIMNEINTMNLQK